MELEHILDIVVKTGEIILKSGAEIQRVEITMEKVLEAYNTKGECFVISSGIFVTVQDNNGTSKTRVKRILGRSTDLCKLEEINAFSRRLVTEQYSYEQAMDKLFQIDKISGYSFPIQLVSAGIMSFVFIFFFDGTIYEAITAGIIAMIVYTVQTKYLGKYFFTFFEYFAASLLAGLLCAGAAKLFPTLGLIKLIIGAIMILVPGSSITNAMKDALNGDIVSSTYKFSETAFIAVAIGSGIAITLSIVLKW